jgi:hypothetical protein
MAMRHYATAWLTALLVCSAGAALGQEVRTKPPGAEEQPPEATGREAPIDGSDWLGIVPGDAQFYVELRGLAEIRRQFVERGIWGVVRSISARDVVLSATQPARPEAGQLLGLDPETAIKQVLGWRAAIIASSSAKWRQGVVLAELDPAADLAAFLTRWGARQQQSEGPIRRYVLRGEILLAVRGRTLAFGPAGDPEGLWGRTILLMAGRVGPTLSGRSGFAGLRSRLSRDYPGLLYVVWPDADPNALGGCDRLLLGVAVEKSEIVCELRGHRDRAEADLPAIPAAVLGALPAETVAVWTGGLDLARVAEGWREPAGVETDLVMQMLLNALIGSRGESSEMAKKLGPACAVVIGREPDAAKLPILPTATVLIDVREGEGLLERLDAALGVFGRLIAFMAAPRGQRPEELPVTQRSFEDVVLHEVNIGPPLARRTGLAFLESLRPCWALWDGRLVLSTSGRHVEEIIRAARGSAARLGETARLRRLLPVETGDGAVAEWCVLRGEVIAEMVQDMLTYGYREHPEAMTRKWWRDWATERLAHADRLGVGLVNDKAGRTAATVLEVQPDSPAARILRRGDVVTGAAGHPLSTTQPAQEVAERYRQRPDAETFALDVERDGRPMRLEIPLPAPLKFDVRRFDPVFAARQIARLAQPAESVTVWRYATGPGRYDAKILIRWNPAKVPPKSTRANQPTSGRAK